MDNPEWWNPKQWEVKDWVIIGTALAAVIGWFRKKIWAPTSKYASTWANLPNVIGRLEASHLTLLSEIKKLEAAVSLGRGTVRAMLDHLNEPVWKSDQYGNCVFANVAMLRMLGVQFSDLEGEGWKSVIWPEDRDRVYHEWQDAVRGGRDFILCYRWIGPDGKPIPICARTQLIRVEGQLAGYLASVELDPTASGIPSH